MTINQTTRDYFEIGDDETLTYDDKLARYRRMVDEYFQVEAYQEFCDRHLAHFDETAHEWFTSGEFDDLLVQEVVSTFPPHEHEQFVAHYRGLLGAWADDAAAQGSARST
jgi:hypothetical protein